MCEKKKKPHIMNANVYMYIRVISKAAKAQATVHCLVFAETIDGSSRSSVVSLALELLLLLNAYGEREREGDKTNGCYIAVASLPIYGSCEHRGQYCIHLTLGQKS